MKKILIFLLLLIPVISFAQMDNRSPLYRAWGPVGINTNGYLNLTDTSHFSLQVGYPGLNKGMLLPQGDTTNVPAKTGGFIYQLKDSSIYYSNGANWQKIGSGSSIPILSTITSLIAYNGTSSIVYVSDSLRGGFFYLASILLTVDNGVTFSSAKPGVWMREYNHNLGVNAEWYGLNPYDNLPDQSYINSALNSPYSHGIVNIGSYSSGTVQLNGSILFGSNMILNIGKPTRIVLDSGTNQYMITNQHPYTVDSNIVINGGIWYGNAANQTKHFATDSVQNQFSGMILNFVHCNNVTVENVTMDTAKSYTTIFIACNNVTVKNSQFWGTANYPNSPGFTYNECSVGFSGTGLYIENTSGHTADDFITIESGEWGTTIDPNNIWPNQTAVSNVHISNVELKDLNGFYTYALIGAWCENDATHLGTSINNIYINNCSGNIASAFVKFAPYPTGQGYFNNIYINDCNFSMPANPISSIYGYNGILMGDFTTGSGFKTDFNNVNITNVTFNNQIYSLPARLVQFYAHANNQSQLSITNCTVLQNTSNANGFPILFDQSDSAGAITFTNVKNIDNANPTKYLYYRDNTPTVQPATINFSNCYVINPNSYPFRTASANGKFSLNGTSLLEQQSLVTNPVAGNVINDPTNGIEWYINNAWQHAITPNLISSPVAGQLLQFNGTNWINWTPTYAPSTGGTGYIQNQYIAAQTASWWVQGQTRTDGGTFNLANLANGKLISTSTLNLSDTINYANPANGIGMYAFNSGTELDNPFSITLTGGVNQIAGLRSDISLNSSNTTTWLNSDAGSAISGLLGVVRAFNNANYGIVSAIGALSPFTFTQAPYTAFTGHIDTMAQVLLYKQTDVANNIDSKIGAPFGILQLSPYPNSFNGGLQLPILTVSSSTILTTANYTVINTSGSNTFTMPAASTCPGQIFNLICNTGTVTLSIGYLNYAGTNTTSIAAGAGVTIQSNGTSYYQIGQ